MNPSFRDSFSAGGRVDPISWRENEKGVPKIWKTLFQHKKDVRSLIDDPSITPYLQEYNSGLLRTRDRYKAWVRQVAKYLKDEHFSSRKINIVDIMLSD